MSLAKNCGFAITVSGRHKMIILIVVLTTTEVYVLEGEDFLTSTATYLLNKNSLIQKNNEFFILFFSWDQKYYSLNVGFHCISTSSYKHNLQTQADKRIIETYFKM
jgi:hypothetical protein